MDEQKLTRSKAKHPPEKVAVERDRIIRKSNKKRRKNMTEWHRQRLAEMDREIEQQNTTKEGNNVTNMTERLDRLEGKMDADELRLSQERDARIAAEVDAKATSLMNSDPSLDYAAATRSVLAEDERFARAEDADQDTDLASAVERRIAADPTNYGDDEGDEPVGSTHDMTPQEYQSEVQRIAKERGYDL